MWSWVGDNQDLKIGLDMVLNKSDLKPMGSFGMVKINMKLFFFIES